MAGMCFEPASQSDVTASMPRPAPGRAIDPVRLEPVDEVVITTLVDNVYDALLVDDPQVTRAPFSAGRAAAAQFEEGSTTVGLRAEHGFSALVTVRRGTAVTRLLFDTGLSPDAMVVNAERLDVDLGDIQAVVLSHGHFDHAGGLSGLAGRRGLRSLPMVVHPGIWTKRRIAIPGREPQELPTLSRRSLDGEGLAVLERRHPSLLVDDSVLITGEVDRTTDFENGMPPSHQAWDGDHWLHDPWVEDDQALVVHVRGRGLVVLTGCGHAGAVNIVRHAQRLTGVTSSPRPRRRTAPVRTGVRADHRADRRCAGVAGPRASGPRALHRVARATRAWRGAPRGLGAGQQRLRLPTAGRLSRH